MVFLNGKIRQLQRVAYTSITLLSAMRSRKGRRFRASISNQQGNGAAAKGITETYTVALWMNGNVLGTLTAAGPFGS